MLEGLGAERVLFEMRVRWAVLAAWQRRALTRLALAGGCAAGGDDAFAVALNLVANEVLRETNEALDRVVDASLLRDREVVAHFLEEAAGRLREVAGVASEALNGALAGGEDATTCLNDLHGVGGGVDGVLDFDVDLSAKAIHRNSFFERTWAIAPRTKCEIGEKRCAPQADLLSA